MVPGAVVQREPGLGQRPGDRTGKRADGIFGRQRAAGTIGEPSRGLGQFRRFGGLPQRAEVRCFPSRRPPLAEPQSTWRD